MGSVGVTVGLGTWGICQYVMGFNVPCICIQGNQYADGKEALFKSNLISREKFNELVSFEHADMNKWDRVPSAS